MIAVDFAFGISTHALTEGDTLSGMHSEGRFHFNSRPHGGRPGQEPDLPRSAVISTHALTEGDADSRRYLCVLQHFNSRPHGGRPEGGLIDVWPDISTHALTEGDGHQAK